MDYMRANPFVNMLFLLISEFGPSMSSSGDNTFSGAVKKASNMAQIKDSIKVEGILPIVHLQFIVHENHCCLRTVFFEGVFLFDYWLSLFIWISVSQIMAPITFVHRYYCS